MKYLIICLMLGMTVSHSYAQSMKWVLMNGDKAIGPCSPDAGRKQQLLCYALEYTPGASGILTSYTTGFYVSCTSMGSPVAKNQSCSMINKVNVTNGCEENGIVLMNSSGNSGTIQNNKVEEGVPVILHQVCFSVPYGETVTVKEDEITNLTTSIDVSPGVFKTEYPTYQEFKIRRVRPDVARPVWLDFKGAPAGHRIAQLDWTTSEEKSTSHYVVERSIDRSNFEILGRVEHGSVSEIMHSYQFMDHNAIEGINYYRLLQVRTDGSSEYSPVRQVVFSSVPFAVTFTPNPADDYILVHLEGHATDTEVQLIDFAGKLILNKKPDAEAEQIRLNIESLDPGVYTLVVESGKDKFNEKVVIVHR